MNYEELLEIIEKECYLEQDVFHFQEMYKEEIKNLSFDAYKEIENRLDLIVECDSMCI